MKKRFYSFVTAAALTAAMLTGCGAADKGGAASSTASYDMAVESAAEYAAGAVVAEENGTIQSSLSPQTGTDRKIVYTASMRMESTRFDDARAALLAAVEDCGGYLESTDQSGSAKEGSRWVSYTVRVPAVKYTAFLEQAGQAGSVLNLNESAQDITLEYVDVQARLESLESKKARLEALADKAETTADLLEIENQLTEVQYQLESYTRQMKVMDHQVDYCTVDISLREVATLTPTGVSFGERIADAFTGGWTAFAAFVQDAVVAIIYNLPLLIIFGILAAVLVPVLRKRRQNKRRKAAKEP